VYIGFSAISSSRLVGGSWRRRVYCTHVFQVPSDQHFLKITNKILLIFIYFFKGDS
jgi:hypothetical protein